MLEEVIRENTAVLRELLAALQSGCVITTGPKHPAAGAPSVHNPAPAMPVKETMAAVREVVRPPEAPAAAAPAAPIQLDDLIAKFRAKAAAPGGSDFCRSMLAELGLKKLTEAAPAQYPAILAKLVA